MERVVVFATLALAWVTVISCQVQLPCDSVLRSFPSLSRFFEHCEPECRYGNWSDVTPVINATPVAVPFNQCKSELALPGERWQVTVDNTSAGCEDIREESYICISTCRDFTSEETHALHKLDLDLYFYPPVRVPSSQCRSGLSTVSGRRLVVQDGYECRENHCERCPDRLEDIYICEPTIAERLVLLFELGRTGQDHHDILLPFDPEGSGYQKRSDSRSSTLMDDDDIYPIATSICSPTLLCDFPYGDTMNKREAVWEQSYVAGKHRPADEPDPLPVDPIPFDFVKHGGRYRRQNSVNCHPDGTRYVLFMIDTSGSIGEQDFKMMTSALSNLVHYFCRRIKIAVLTFSEYHYVEFCFDCFTSSCNGRDRARDAMADITYRAGLTFTGEATECACHHVLKPKCGFPDLLTENTACLDVVYVTDGRSNGYKDVCSSVQCLYDLENNGVELNVFAFGIGDYNIDELQCITRNNSNNYAENKIFEVDNFTHFADAINSISRDVFGTTVGANIPGVPDCFTINTADGIGDDDCSNSST